MTVTKRYSLLILGFSEKTINDRTLNSCDLTSRDDFTTNQGKKLNLQKIGALIKRNLIMT